MAKARGRSKKRQGPALITDARGSRIKNFDHRRHVYAVLQWSRLPLLLLAGASIMWWDNKWLATIFVVASVPMSWIAVVIANGVGEPADKRAPRVYKPGVVREQNRRWEEQQRAAQIAQAAPKQLVSAEPGDDGEVVSPPENHGARVWQDSSESAPGTNSPADSPDFDENMVIDMPTDLPED